jgi:hypothetical protein
MIDAIKLKFVLESGAEEALLSPAFAGHSGEPDNDGWLFTEMENLRLSYHQPTRSGYVKGSLHAFGKGNNFSDISFSELIEAADKLNQALGLPPDRLQVQTMEAGMNIPMPEDAKPFLQSLIRFKKAPFKELESPIPYALFRAALTEYNVKLYNKSRYEALYGIHLLRYELQFKKSRAINRAVGLPEKYSLLLADVVEESVLHPLSNYLLNAWKMIERETKFDTTGLSHSEMKLLYAGLQPDYWEGIKNASTKKYERRQYKRIREQVAKVEVCPVTAVLTRKLNQFFEG